jgi:hypothetical protein
MLPLGIVGSLTVLVVSRDMPSPIICINHLNVRNYIGNRSADSKASNGILPIYNAKSDGLPTDQSQLLVELAKPSPGCG